jgi:toxin-antitoxin system PIN domain toxin
VIAVDSNILVYAHREESPFHVRALRRVTELAEGQATWAIPWPCLHEFVGVVTHPRVYLPPTPLATAIETVDRWLKSPALVLLTETQTHWKTLRGVVEPARITGPKIHDARVVALCLQHGVSELWSADRDFSRFPQVRVVNPLVSERA